MKQRRHILIIPAVLALGLMLAACGNADTTASGPAETEIETEAGAGGLDRETQSPETAEPGQDTSGDPAGKPETDISGSDSAGQTAPAGGSYFKSGDFTYRLRVSPGVPENPDSPVLSFYKRDRNFSNSFYPLHTLRLAPQAKDGVYEVEDTGGGQKGTALTVEWARSGPIVLHGEMEEAGTYYPVDENLIMPEQFERPLNETDMIGLTAKDMGLMRNQFYAVYGRAFKTEELKNHFEAQPWYEARLSADSFDETLLSGLEKRNIAFLKAAAESYDEAKAQETKAAYAALPEAPYRNLLPERGEILVELSSDSEHAGDRGIYYEAQGTISVPITITRAEYQALANGTELKPVSDELTGETVVLKKAENTQYGEYVMVDPRNPDEDNGTYVNFTYDPYSQTFSMWANSADTVFKKAYEGNIFVLKGACEEYYNYFNLPDSARPQGAGAFRVMDFNEADPYGPSPYMGNILVTDDKGYVKALYYMGD